MLHAVALKLALLTSHMDKYTTALWCIVRLIIVQMDLPVDGVSINPPKQDSFA